ncbi:MAG TPA: F0F1 ATP synthase subunit B [Candidatus Saccharimonadales bacterium]|nr:F0F1 ATP synthase subunit B [Candidatus Saccharimonadales bacterium]
MISYFADSSSGIGALGFDGQAFLIQLITFVLAYLVLRRYAFGPILNVLKQRRETIERSVELTEKLQKQQTELDQKVEQVISGARQEADSIIATAQDVARQTVRDSEDKARVKAIQILKDAETDVAQITSRARQALEKEMVGLVSEATEAIIEEKLDDRHDIELIERTLRSRQAA